MHVIEKHNDYDVLYILLRLALCIYYETNRRIENLNKYFVATGNIYRDYEFDFGDETFVKKAKLKTLTLLIVLWTTKKIKLMTLEILEIERPFVLSFWIWKNH
ncbi:PREDICTED: uncharacterized protein LOC107072639 isoform X2 [Polistes dominula]|uniref:Uncharacterized protein LOC107072636 n=1 Tax=Polistes dominula TaxID=743375 RepID=A0ABM1J6X1_POLDO|nr:PREDICTED: uncharacterized protein LOC107072636 [Polistes dominula]XP_015188214.1 PREDICTED: uncharacterized protein LOC107072639 isoform X2 [Polistes dominula]